MPLVFYDLWFCFFEYHKISLVFAAAFILLLYFVQLSGFSKAYLRSYCFSFLVFLEESGVILKCLLVFLDLRIYINNIQQIWLSFCLWIVSFANAIRCVVRSKGYQLIRFSSLIWYYFILLLAILLFMFIPGLIDWWSVFMWRCW
jgi:hypothetical protein